METNNGVVYHCIECGKTWGTGIDVDSYGICIECFANWCRQKQKDSGLKECFGEFKEHDECDCDLCPRKDKCKEYHEIKHDLSGRLKEPTRNIG